MEALAAGRAPIYAKMLENPEVLSKEQWPRNGDLLEEPWIVDDPSALPSVVRRMIEERREGGPEPK
jgi:hypothetical protein